MDLTSAILGQLSQSGGLDALGSLIGTDSDGAQAGITSAIPAIIGAMANNASSTDGAASLLGALDNDHDGSILDSLGGLLGGGGQSTGGQDAGGFDIADGMAILGHVFGNRQDDVTYGVAKQSGLNLGTVMKLLPIIAPIVMGYLGRRKREENLDADRLGSLLQTERQTAEQSNPGLGGLAGLLDANDDGSVADELIGMMGQLFKQR